jgi:hypothetical protein
MKILNDDYTSESTNSSNSDGEMNIADDLKNEYDQEDED